MEVGQILTTKDLVELVGTDKQKSSYYKNNNIGTNVKKSLLKQLSRFCSYEEIKIKRRSHFKILEIYSEVKESEDKRNKNGNNNKKFTKHLELSILKLCKNIIEEDDCLKNSYSHLLTQDQNIKSFTITKNNLMLSIGVINKSYKEYNSKRRDLAKELNAKLENVDEAYIRTEKLSNQVFTAMNKLRKNRNINYSNAYLIEENVYILDDYGQPLCDDKGVPITTVEKSVHVETTNKYNLITKIERETLEEMEINYNILAFNPILKKEFYKRVDKKLLKYRINKCYKVIKISVISTKLLEKDIEILEKDWMLCNHINNLSSYNIMIENSYNRNKKELDNSFGTCEEDVIKKINEEKLIYNTIIRDYYRFKEDDEAYINNNCYKFNNEVIK